MIPLPLLFPKIMPRLISLQMEALVLPFAVAHVFTATYLSTMREVMR